MKKFIAFLLTFVCLMTTSVPVFAANEVEVFFDGNGGTFNYYMGEVKTGDYFGDSAKVGTKISDKQNAVLTDPVFGDSSREFLGWMPYELQMAAPPAPIEMIPLATEPITSQEALDYVIPNCTIQFVAQWAGEEVKKEQRVEINSGLQEVPNGVADKYTSITDIENALAEKALKANENFVVDKVKSVFMDVELQFKNASGEWESVTYDNFPTEGVEAVLPYPDGTNKEDFDFIIAHMISAGDRAGEIEILNGVYEEDGIRVKFTSMSPVMIMYQAKNTTDTPTDTTTNVESPKTGDTSNIWLMFALLLVSGGALVVLGIKRKSMI